MQQVLALQNELKKKKLGGLLVSNPNNVLYLSGISVTQNKLVQQLTDPEILLFITPTSFYVLADARYLGIKGNYAKASYITIPSPPSATNIAMIIKTLLKKGTLLAIELGSLLAQDYKSLQIELQDIDMLDASDIVTNQRVLKTPKELNLLRKAAEITSQGFEYALSKLKLGMSEKDLATEITTYFLKYADGNSFAPIVAFGVGSAIPHYIPQEKVKITNKGILLIDLGCNYKGYMGDMTRTVYLGKADKKIKAIYNIVLAAQKRALSNIKIGMSGNQLDQVARKYIEKNGYGENYTHGTGHGLGLAVHEQPAIKSTSTSIIQKGMVFSIEPGIYIPKYGGIRIEDIVYVGDNNVMNLTKSPKTLREIKL